MYRRNFIKVMTFGAILPSLAVATLTATTTSTAQAATETTATLPTAAKITNMPVYAQQHHLSCEYSATRAALARWGIQISEATFIKAIGVNQNPHLGFRGNIDGNWGGVNDYGIYAEPIARFLKTQGVNTKLLWNGVTSIKEELSYGRPVVVWIIGGMWSGTSVTSEAGGVGFTLAADEHAMTLYGYDANGVYSANPGSSTYGYYSWAVFSRSWSVLGNMAMSVWPSSEGMVTGEVPGIDPEFYHYWLNVAGLSLNGQPLDASFNKNNKLYQYFERTRLEYDSAQPAAFQVSRGLLGTEVTANRRNEAAFQALNSTEIAALNATDKANFYSTTGFYIARQFADFWQAEGALPVFGYPISRPFTENGLVVQYFERARLELQPATAANAAYVSLGLLGQEQFSTGQAL
ncbi:MAG: C39 family peptidase [Chloroflexi bacterium]|nr:C39 family peptidase [Chloroflexota bacterium]OJV91879.1 MAG: hypothetical protein BGO39_14215 [Chloroflexi bacterium 54-19]